MIRRWTSQLQPLTRGTLPHRVFGPMASYFPTQLVVEYDDAPIV